MGLENVAHVTLPDENGVEYDYYIRKLTPRETWRGMGFSDEDFEKAEKVNSSSQLYKQAGNSIVKQCLMAIFRELLPDEDNYSDLRQLIGSL